MFWRGFFVKALLALLLVFVLAIGGIMIFQFGAAQGYQAGTLAANSPANPGSSSAPAVGTPFYRQPIYGYPFHRPFFGPMLIPPMLCFLGIFFLLGIMFLFPLMMAGRMRRMYRCGMAGGPNFEERAREWRQHFGHMPPPWAAGGQAPSGEEAPKPAPESGEAQ